MRFLLDQDVYAITLQYLRDLEHDAVPVADLGLSRAADSVLLKEAQRQKRIFITRDRDFGNLVFVKGLETGVIYLRMLPSTKDAIHTELGRVLSTYSEDELRDAFIVIEPGRHRFRKLSSAK